MFESSEYENPPISPFQEQYNDEMEYSDDIMHLTEENPTSSLTGSKNLDDYPLYAGLYEFCLKKSAKGENNGDGPFKDDSKLKEFVLEKNLNHLIFTMYQEGGHSLMFFYPELEEEKEVRYVDVKELVKYFQYEEIPISIIDELINRDEPQKQIIYSNHSFVNIRMCKSKSQSLSENVEPICSCYILLKPSLQYFKIMKQKYMEFCNSEFEASTKESAFKIGISKGMPEDVKIEKLDIFLSYYYKHNPIVTDPDPDKNVLETSALIATYTNPFRLRHCNFSDSEMEIDDNIDTEFSVIEKKMRFFLDLSLSSKDSPQETLEYSVADSGLQVNEKSILRTSGDLENEAINNVHKPDIVEEKSHYTFIDQHSINLKRPSTSPILNPVEVKRKKNEENNCIDLEEHDLKVKLKTLVTAVKDDVEKGLDHQHPSQETKEALNTFCAKYVDKLAKSSFSSFKYCDIKDKIKEEDFRTNKASDNEALQGKHACSSQKHSSSFLTQKVIEDKTVAGKKFKKSLQELNRISKRFNNFLI